MSTERVIQPQDIPSQETIPPEVPAVPLPTQMHPFSAPPLRKGHHDLYIGQAAVQARVRMETIHRPGLRIPHPAQHGNQR